MFFWGLTLRSTFNYVGYTGLDTGTEDYCLWNLSLGKKFLKNNAAGILHIGWKATTVIIYQAMCWNHI